MRLIDPIALKESIAFSAIMRDGKSLETIIDEQPSVQPKRGRWERGFDGNHAVCSNCQAWWIPFGEGYKTDYHFCPNCGADMRGEQDG